MRKMLLILSLILPTLTYSRAKTNGLILQAPGFFGISQILIYAGGIIVIVVTILMAMKRKKRFDDEDITD